MTKKTYTAPVLRVHGTVEAMTKANTGGSTLDAPFGIGDSIDDLTTS